MLRKCWHLLDYIWRQCFHKQGLLMWVSDRQKSLGTGPGLGKGRAQEAQGKAKNVAAEEVARCAQNLGS